MQRFGIISTRLYTRANPESYKNLEDKNRGVQESNYFKVLTGPIFYDINQSMRIYWLSTF